MRNGQERIIRIIEDCIVDRQISDAANNQLCIPAENSNPAAGRLNNWCLDHQVGFYQKDCSWQRHCKNDGRYGRELNRA